jgi:hypothetical protein
MGFLGLIVKSLLGKNALAYFARSVINEEKSL